MDAPGSATPPGAVGRLPTRLPGGVGLGRLRGMSTDPEPLSIRDDMIRLGQAMKLANLVEDGQQARTVITEGYVSVNGRTVTERGRQLHPGDVIEFSGRAVRLEKEA